MSKILGYRSDVGSYRYENEDSAIAIKNDLNDCMLIVCDGLGSYRGSKDAACILASNFVNSFRNKEYKKYNLKRWFELIIDLTRKDYQNLIELHSDYCKMATTVVLAIVINNKSHIFWTGDSRAYLLNPETSIQLTKDHNLENYFIDKKASQKTFDKYKANLNAVTHVIDVNSKFYYDYKQIVLKKNNILVLTSDGLHNFVNIKELYKYFNVENNDDLNLSKIIDIAINNGSDDNISFSFLNYK